MAERMNRDGGGRRGHAAAPIHVLLATYNGARFLPELLDSLLGQSDPDWVLLARDDGSSDETVAMLRAHAARDARIRVIHDERGTLGSVRNFARLAEVATGTGAEYFAFCDQDDRWHPDKLARLRERLREVETLSGSRVPLLAFSDLRVVDAAGAVRAPSYFRYAGVRLRPGDGHYWLIAQNAIPGCAMLGNRALLELALPLPPAAVHHDWWFALCAAAAGGLVRVQESLVDYRVHGDNVVGVRPVSARVLEFVRRPLRRSAEEDAKFRAAERQARALSSRLRRRGIRNHFSSVLENYLRSLLAPAAPRRLVGVLATPVRRLGFARNALLFHQLARLRRTWSRLG